MRAAGGGWFYYALLGATVALLAAIGAFALWYAFPFWMDELRPGGEVTLGLVGAIFEYAVILFFTTILSTLILARIRQQRRRREAEDESRRAEAARRTEIAAIEETLRDQFVANIVLLAGIGACIKTMVHMMKPLLDALREVSRSTDPAPTGSSVSMPWGSAPPLTLAEVTPILDAYYAWQLELGSLAVKSGELESLLAGLRQRSHAAGAPEAALGEANGLVVRLSGFARVSGFSAEIIYHSIHAVLGAVWRPGNALRVMDCYRVNDLLLANALALIEYIEQRGRTGADNASATRDAVLRSVGNLRQGVAGLAAALARDEREFRAEVGKHAAAT